MDSRIGISGELKNRPRCPSGQALEPGPGGTWLNTRAGAVQLPIAGEWLTKPDIGGRTRIRIYLKPSLSLSGGV